MVSRVATPTTINPSEVILTPLPAVTTPIESTLVTSSYVNTPSILTFPSKSVVPLN